MLGGIQRYLNSVIDALRRCTDPILVLFFYALSTGASETDPEEQSSPPSSSSRDTRHRFLARAMRGELFTPVPPTSSRYPHRLQQNKDNPLTEREKHLQRTMGTTPSLRGYTIKSWPDGKNPSYPTGGDDAHAAGMATLHIDAMTALLEFPDLLGQPTSSERCPAGDVMDAWRSRG